MRAFQLLAPLLLTAAVTVLLCGADPSYGKKSGYASSPTSPPDDFDHWVQHIQDTCHPDANEDVEDPDHLPARPHKYEDEVFNPWVKEKKMKKHLSKPGSARSYSYGNKPYTPSRQLTEKRQPVLKKEKKPIKKDKKETIPAHQQHQHVFKKPAKKETKHEKFPPKMSHGGKNETRHKNLPPRTSHGSVPSPAPNNLTSPVTFPNSMTGGNGKVIVVAKDGSGDFTTIQAAINSVPVNNKQRVIIFAKKGIYREKVLIPSSKPFITLKGENAALTYIQWGDTAATKGPEGKPLGTYGSASVAIEADNFIALDISFKNTAPPPKGGAVGAQAVALRIQGDKAAFYRCSFYGAQDTLYDLEGRHYYYMCYIEGSIDFIFGDGRSLFVKCHIHSIAAPFGSITAQNRITPTENTGYSFAYCMVTGTGTIYLGRAWGAYSRVVYAFTYFDNIILPEGWNDWNTPANDRRVFYGEYRCYGPGANTAGRVKWSRQLTPVQAKPFLSIAFIDGSQWLGNA